MEAVFLRILNMSITASYVIAAVILIRLLLRKAPKKYAYLLWSVVGFRLCCPVTFQSAFSIFSLRLFDMTAAQSTGGATLQYVPDNIGMMAQPQVSVGISTVNTAISSSLPAASPMTSVNPMQIWIAAAALIWCAGMAILAIYSVFSWLHLYRRMSNAVLLEGNVYESDKVHSPFILGFFRPRIYIPFGLDKASLHYVLMHERYHLKRRDHMIRLFAFFLLVVHWFNPLCWLAFNLMGRDMEMSCDEKVLSGEENSRKAYSMTLLSFATNRRFPQPNPLSFAETGVKSRIKNVLRWQSPKLGVTAAAIALCVIVVAACAANPVKRTEDPFGAVWQVSDIVVYDAPQYSFVYLVEDAPQYYLTSDYQLMVMGDMQLQDEENMDQWQLLGDVQEVTLIKENFDDYFLRNGDLDMLWPDNVSAETLRHDNQKAWSVINENHILYYILQQKNGDVYLAYGYDNVVENGSASEDLSSIRWLFLLTEADESGTVDGKSQSDTVAAVETSAADKTKDDLLDSAIVTAVLEHNKSGWSEGVPFVSYVPLMTEAGGPAKLEQVDTVTVYAMVLYQRYKLEDGAIYDVGGSHIPTALTFEVSPEGECTLTEYWEPRDGSYYAPDIQKKFPENIYYSALDTQQYILQQIQSCYAQAVSYFDVDTDQVLGKLIDVILSSPEGASDIQACIEEHPIEYRELTYYGVYTQEYITEQLQSGEATGLRAELMRAVQNDLDLN